MGLDNFKKFIVPKKNNAAVKEKIKQDKKIAKKLRQEAIERHFEEKRAVRSRAFNQEGTSPAPKQASYSNSPKGAGKKDQRRAYPGGKDAPQ
jgi:hypothetical protein